MAKKQGVSYSPNTALMQGAGTAYKNWDNVPGVYAGLDKGVEGGMDLAKDQMAELEKQELKEQGITNRVDAMKQKIQQEGGSLSEVDYSHATKFMEGLGARYEEASKNKDNEELAKITTEYNGYLSNINTQKQNRINIGGDPEDPDNTGLSKSVKGRDLDILTTWGEGKYKEVYTNEDTKEKVYVMEMPYLAFGQTLYEDVEMTEKEIMGLANYKSPETSIKFSKFFNTEMNRKELTSNERLKGNIERNIVPDSPQALNAYLNDEGFGMEKSKTFTQLMQLEENKSTVLGLIDEKTKDYFDGNDNKLDAAEYKNFLNAITSPSHPFWQGNMKAWDSFARPITAEALTNITRNTWLAENPQEIEENDGGGDIMKIMEENNSEESTEEKS